MLSEPAVSEPRTFLFDILLVVTSLEDLVPERGLLAFNKLQDLVQIKLVAQC